MQEQKTPQESIVSDSLAGGARFILPLPFGLKVGRTSCRQYADPFPSFPLFHFSTLPPFHLARSSFASPTTWGLLNCQDFVYASNGQVNRVMSWSNRILLPSWVVGDLLAPRKRFLKTSFAAIQEPCASATMNAQHRRSSGDPFCPTLWHQTSFAVIAHPQCGGL